MRIALMPSAYAPAVGGVEVLTARLAHQLAGRGHQVEVWAPRSPDDGLPEREVIDGIPVRRFEFPMPRMNVGVLAGWPLAAAGAVRRLRAAVRDLRPDLLHVQCFSGNGAYATAVARIEHLPLVVTLQGETMMDDHDIYDRSVTLQGALRAGLRQAAHVTGCSQFTLDDAQARFALDPAKASVLFNGVDLDEVPPRPVPLPFDRYVVALGRAVRKKGFDLLIEAFAKVVADDPDVGLVIGGDGAALPGLRALAERIGVDDRVHFTGRLDRGQVAAVMAGAEVFVMPSRLEPFGIVALEAWRAGVPVVATSRGGPREFVGAGGRGLVVDPEDGEALAGAIRDLLHSSALRERLVERAGAALPGFTWAAITDQYERVYAGAAAAHAAAVEAHSVR